MQLFSSQLSFFFSGTFVARSELGTPYAERDNLGGDAPELIKVQNAAYPVKYRHEHDDMAISELPSPGVEEGRIGNERITRTVSEMPSSIVEVEGGKVKDEMTWKQLCKGSNRCF